MRADGAKADSERPCKHISQTPMSSQSISHIGEKHLLVGSRKKTKWFDSPQRFRGGLETSLESLAKGSAH